MRTDARFHVVAEVPRRRQAARDSTGINPPYSRLPTSGRGTSVRTDESHGIGGGLRRTALEDRTGPLAPDALMQIHVHDERNMRPALSRLSPLALLIVAASSAEAQVLHGRVLDRETRDPIASASVLVINPDGNPRNGAITDRNGNFLIRTSPGTFQLGVRRVGYVTTGSIALELSRSDTLSFEVLLAEQAVQHDSLTITTNYAPVRDPSGFFARQTDLIGSFLGPYDVERRRPGSPADLLHDIPGFRVLPQAGGFRVLMTGRGRMCEPTVYVDGRLAYRGSHTSFVEPVRDDLGVFLEPLVNANAIRAMEAYQNGTTAPVRFRPVGPIGGGDCGVLVFWTRLGFGR